MHTAKCIDVKDLCKSELHLHAGDALRDYPYKKKPKIVRMNSTGRCNLACSYCFTNESKKNISIGCKEVDFLFQYLGENIFFICTGVGDFFAGYPPKERFLENMLCHDAKLFLDANGVLIHEFPELSDQNISKIVYFDLSFHYNTMKKKGFLEQWQENAVIISKRIPHHKMIVKTIFSFEEMELWPEILNFYTDKIFPHTNRLLSIALDEFDARMQKSPVHKLVNSLIKKFPESVAQNEFNPQKDQTKTYYDTAVSFTDKDMYDCPAGSRYYKIDIYGNAYPCDKTGGYLASNKIVLGNVFKQQLYFLKNNFLCPRLEGPACIDNFIRFLS